MTSIERDFRAQCASIPTEGLFDLGHVYRDAGQFWRARLIIDELTARICPPPPREPPRGERRAVRLAALTARVDRKILPWRNRCRRMGWKLPLLYEIRSLQDAANILLAHHVHPQEVLGVSKAHGRQMVSRYRWGRRS